MEDISYPTEIKDAAIARILRLFLVERLHKAIDRNSDAMQYAINGVMTGRSYAGNNGRIIDIKV